MSVRNDIFDNLMTALKLIGSSNDYDANIRTVKPYHQNYLEMYKDDTPVLMVIDHGNEQILVSDATHTHCAFDVDVVGYTTGSFWEETQKSMNDIRGSLKQFVDEEPDIGSQVLWLLYVEELESAIDGEQLRGVVGVRLRIHYWA